MRELKHGRDSELLLEAIGEINDSFIFEAESYVKKKSSPVWRKLVIAAAALTLVFTLTLSVGIGLMLGGLSNKDSIMEDSGVHDGTDDIMTDLPDDENNDAAQPIVTLEDALTKLRYETQSFNSPLEREMLFDGETRIIWKYSDEEDYRICTVSSAIDETAIRSYIKSKKGFTAADSTKESEIDGFWICFGDGLVYTPYLKTSDGNIGYGDVFDYENELEPSTDFAELINRVIDKKVN